MEKIIVDLLQDYGHPADKKTVKTLIRLMELGFDYKWLRNMQIIKEFDEMYKTEKPVMEIYSELSISNQDLSVNHIRKIISDRQLYEF